MGKVLHWSQIGNFQTLPVWIYLKCFRSDNFPHPFAACKLCVFSYHMNLKQLSLSTETDLDIYPISYHNTSHYNLINTHTAGYYTIYQPHTYKHLILTSFSPKGHILSKFFHLFYFHDSNILIFATMYPILPPVVR